MTKYLLFSSLLLMALLSCSEENASFEIGSGNVNVRTRMSLIDTITVKSYTVMLDSVPVSQLSNPAITIGRYVDDQIGTVTANSFFRVSRAESFAGKYSINPNAVFDSLRLFIIYNKDYAGDTTQPFTINVHRLTAPLKPNTDGYFYNHHDVPCAPELFGSATFLPSPNSNDTIWIKLDTIFGNELFNLMKSNDQKIGDNDYFQEYFRGLKLAYDNTNEAVIGFSFPLDLGSTAYPAMRLYYHYTGATMINKIFDFKVETTNSKYFQSHYNQFTLEDPTFNFPAQQRDKLPASQTNNSTFILSGIGIVTRFEVPYLKNLLGYKSDIRILDASIQIEPVRNTYSDIPLPGSLSLYTTDNLNHWGSELSDKSGRKQTGNLKIDWINQEETFYTFDVTNYMISKLAEQTDVIPAMILTVPVEDLYKTTHRAILGSQTNPRNKVKLKLYYLNIE